MTGALVRTQQTISTRLERTFGLLPRVLKGSAILRNSRPAVLGILLFLCGPGWSQSNWALETGLNLAKFNIQNIEIAPEESLETSLKRGFQLGVQWRKKFIEDLLQGRLAFSVNVNLVQRGTNWKYRLRDDNLALDAQRNIRAFYLHLPLNLLYELPLTWNEGNFYLGGGAYMGLGLGGYYRETTEVIRNNTDLNFREGESLAGVQNVSSIDRSNVSRVAASDQIYLNLLDLGGRFSAGWRGQRMEFEINFLRGLMSLDPPVRILGVSLQQRNTYHQSFNFTVRWLLGTAPSE